MGTGTGCWYLEQIDSEEKDSMSSASAGSVGAPVRRREM